MNPSDASTLRPSASNPLIGVLSADDEFVQRLHRILAAEQFAVVAIGSEKELYARLFDFMAIVYDAKTDTTGFLSVVRTYVHNLPVVFVGGDHTVNLDEWTVTTPRDAYQAGGAMAEMVARLRPTDVRLKVAAPVIQIVKQAILDLRHGTVFAHEMLARWQDGRSPLDMIHEAEERGQMVELGRRMRKATAESLPPGPAFVNLHREELLDPTLYTDEDVLAAKAEHVILDLSRDVITHVDRLKARLEILRFVGYRVAVEIADADLIMVAMLEAVKPDFVRVRCDLEARSNIEDAVREARAVGARIILTEIDSDERLAFARSLKCDLTQGFLLARPC